MESSPPRFRHLAEQFDEPYDSPLHSDMAQNAWIGGDFVTVPYFLGRLQEINYFRMSDLELDQAVQRFIAAQYSEAVTILFCDRKHWHLVAEVLQQLFLLQRGEAPSLKPKVFAAYEQFLRKPSSTLEEVARQAGTTEKQVRKMSSLVWAHADFQRLPRGT